MPQMSPMSWMMLSLFIFTFFVLFNSLVSIMNVFVKHSFHSSNTFLVSWGW